MHTRALFAALVASLISVTTAHAEAPAPAARLRLTLYSADAKRVDFDCRSESAALHEYECAVTYHDACDEGAKPGTCSAPRKWRVSMQRSSENTWTNKQDGLVGAHVFSLAHGPDAWVYKETDVPGAACTKECEPRQTVYRSR